MDELLIKIIEKVFNATRVVKEKKIDPINSALDNLDSLKFFLQIAWEIKVVDDKKYLNLSEPIAEIGRMLGGWYKQLQKETPAPTKSRTGV